MAGPTTSKPDTKIVVTPKAHHGRHHLHRTTAGLAEMKADSANVAAANRAMLDSLKRTGKAASVADVGNAVSADQMARTNAAFDEAFKKPPAAQGTVVKVKGASPTTNAFNQRFDIV